MFLSKEKREQRKELEAQIVGVESRLEGKRQHLERRQRGKRQAIETYKQSVATKWEYLQVSNKDIKGWESLNRLGNEGWELVGLSTYTEKHTAFGTVEGMIYIMYVFKRPVPDIPKEVLSSFSDIDDITSEIGRLATELRSLKAELSAL